jgi:hypothetical protein
LAEYSSRDENDALEGRKEGRPPALRVDRNKTKYKILFRLL